MQRLLAALLIASLSLPLTMAFVRANSEAELPACCRRDGKHACGMMKRAAEAPSTGPAVASKKVPCAQYPSGKAIPVGGKAALPTGQLIAFTLPVASATITQRETPVRLSLARPCSGRGPPSSLQA